MPVTKISPDKKRRPKQNLPTKIKEWILAEDLFQGYRYKKARVEINPISGKKSVFQPYIKHKDSSSHEYALNFNEWLEIQEIYWNIVCEFLVQGHQYELPKNMGFIELIRYRPPKANIRKNIQFRNSHTMGFSPKIVWRRRREKGFLHKAWYIFNISRKKQWNKISKALYAEPTLIYKYPE